MNSSSNTNDEENPIHEEQYNKLLKLIKNQEQWMEKQHKINKKLYRDKEKLEILEEQNEKLEKQNQRLEQRIEQLERREVLEKESYNMKEIQNNADNVSKSLVIESNDVEDKIEVHLRYLEQRNKQKKKNVQNKTNQQQINDIKVTDSKTFQQRIEELEIQNEQLMKKTEKLEIQLGAPIMFDSEFTDETNNDETEKKLLLVTDNGWTNDIDRNQNVVLFDIPTFFCCIIRFLYSIMGLIAFFSYYSLSILGYYIAVIKILIIILEAFTQKMNGKIKKVTIVFYIIGGIISWVSFSTVMDEHFNYVGESYIAFLAGGIITIITEIFLILKTKQISKTWKFSHACDALAIFFLLLTTYDLGSQLGAVSMFLFLLFLILQSFVMFFGLPMYHKGDQLNLSQDSIQDLNNDDQSLHETNQMRNPIQPNPKSLTDIVLEHQQQLQCIESKLEPPTSRAISNYLQPKGLSQIYTTRASLSTDVYTMMMISRWQHKLCFNPCVKKSMIIMPYPSKSWMLGIVVFLIQTLLASYTLLDQQNTEFGDTRLKIPIRITAVVRVGQFLTLILAIMTQTDLLVSFRVLLFLSYDKDTWLDLVGHEHKTLIVWLGRILVPNAMKSFQGLLVLVTTFIVIIQSNNIVDLLKDFTALFVISSIDNMFFFMADHGYLGRHLSSKTNKAKKTTIQEDDKNIHLYLHIFSFIIIFSLFGGWIIVCYQQQRGVFINQKYPSCRLEIDFKNYYQYIGDGRCDFSKNDKVNILECGWEGGDCEIFNTRYPNCTVDEPNLVDNQLCDSGSYNTIECGFDGGDCIEFNERYPDCKVTHPDLIGNKECNAEGNVFECGYDGGDCLKLDADLHQIYPDCVAVYPPWVGNGVCNGGSYNTTECGFDGGDCQN